LGDLPETSVRKVRYREQVISTGQQLMQPVMSGVFTAIVACVVMGLKSSDSPNFDIGRLVAVGFGLAGC